MPKFVDMFGGEFTNAAVQIYTDSKVGQYSVCLDKTPIYITYFPINQPISTASEGLNGIEHELGKHSPIRYNQINNFPMYGFPELKPDLTYDETGLDIDMDLTGLIVLPNTIKPTFGDYFIVKLANCPALMFRVNMLEYNTIMSNDFYILSADLKYIEKDGENVYDKIKGQIIDEFETIFNNIGTEDKCFIRTTDLVKLREISDFYNKLSDMYRTVFFDTDLNTFVCKNYMFDNLGNLKSYYDANIERFIIETEIYYNPDSNITTVVTPCNDVENQKTLFMYRKTLLYAIANKEKNFLSDYMYALHMKITEPFSVFNIYGIYTEGVTLFDNGSLIDSAGFEDYYDRELIAAIKYPDGNYPEDLLKLFNSENDEPSINESIIETIEDGENNSGEGEEVEPEPSIDPPVEEPNVYEYIPKTYLEEIILDYMNGILSDIDKQKVYTFALKDDVYTYQYMPIILFIVYKYYMSYYEKVK